MTIVIDARELRTSTGRYIERHLNYLQKLDNENDYIVLLKPADLDDWQPSNPRFKKLACRYREFSFGEQLGYAWLLYKLRADLVHFGMTHQPILYFRSAVTTVHDLTTARFFNPAKNWLTFKLKQWVYRGVIWVVAHKSKALITPSEYVRQDLAFYARVKPAKITVTHEAADKITVTAEPVKELNGKRFLVYIGRAQPHKNLKRLVDAYQELKWIYPDLLLCLAGKHDGNYRRLERYVQNKKVGGVVFAGFVSEGQLRWLYEHAEAYVFPSLSEGFGLPGLEAMLHGLPVASSSATCLPEIYDDGALYFDPKSPRDMADKIKQLLDDKSLAKEVAGKGRQVAGQYSWEEMSRQTLEVYKKILNK